MLTHRWHDSVENPKESTHTHKKKRKKKKLLELVKKFNKVTGCLVLSGFYYHYYLILYSQGDNGLVTTVLLTRIIACTSAAFPRISLK